MCHSMCHRSHDQGGLRPGGDGGLHAGGEGGLHPGGGLHRGGQTPFPPMGFYGIRSTSGRYASYWNAFLFSFCTDIFAKIYYFLPLQTFRNQRERQMLYEYTAKLKPHSQEWFYARDVLKDTVSMA